MTNSVSILQTKLSNREGHETVSRALRSLRRKSHKVLSATLVAAHVQAATNPHWLSSIQRCPRPSNDASRGLSSRSARGCDLPNTAPPKRHADTSALMAVALMISPLH